MICPMYFTFAHTVRLFLDNLKTGKFILLSSLVMQIITTLYQDYINIMIQDHNQNTSLKAVEDQDCYD